MKFFMETTTSLTKRLHVSLRYGEEDYCAKRAKVRRKGWEVYDVSAFINEKAEIMNEDVFVMCYGEGILETVKYILQGEKDDIPLGSSVPYQTRWVSEFRVKVDINKAM